MNQSTIGVKLEPNVRKRLKTLSQIKDRSTHWMMKAAIEEYLDREEQRERERQEDRERWERYVAGGKTIAREDVSIWLDSIGSEQELKCPR